jgi:CubicO group peptidase (beta-lactamase class C family)
MNLFKTLSITLITLLFSCSNETTNTSENKIDTKNPIANKTDKIIDQEIANPGFKTAAELRLMVGFPPPESKRVNRSNALMTPPYNRWSYLHMRTLYPTAGIPSAQKSFDIKREIDENISKLKIENPETGEKYDFDRFLKETYSDAFVVIHKNKIVYESYLNGMNADQPHQMMSCTKSFAGLFALLAVDEGKMNESDLVTKILPELKTGGAFDGATVKQVLNMTNSMDFSEDYADPNSGIVHYATVLGFMAPQEGKEYANSIYEFLPTIKQEKKYAHGEIFNYQTPKTDVVNWLTNRASGRSFQKDMYEKLWSKLGTSGETYVLLDANGTLFAGGGLNATPNNLARFGMMMINDGKFNGNQVVSPDVIQKIAKGGNIEAFSNGPLSSGPMGNKDWSYRAQWWVRHTSGKEAFSAIGINGQWIYIDVDRDVAIIKQSSQPVSSSEFFDGFNFNAFDTIIEHLTK